MISRVADSCFWLTRYLERVHSLATLLEVNAGFSLDVAMPDAERWRPLVVVAGQEEHFLETLGEAKIDDGEAVQEYLTWNADHPSSIFASLGGARENARTIREVMSVEMWECLNDAWLWLKSRSGKRLYESNRNAFYQRISSECMMFHGICYSTMLHEEPFVFMKLGRAVERVGQTARILDVRHHSLGEVPRKAETPADSAQWLAILRSLSASEPFFRHATHALSGPAVARFVIFDRAFPRSVLHNLDRTRGLMARIQESDPPGLIRESWERLERLRGSLLQMTPDDVLKTGLHRVLTWIVDESTELCDAIHRDYLDPPTAVLRHQLLTERLAQDQGLEPKPDDGRELAAAVEEGAAAIP